MRPAAYLSAIACLFILLPQGLVGQDFSGRQLIRRGTPVKLRLAKTISSAHARKGDGLDFVVADDVGIDKFTIIKAGAVAKGSVTSVKGKRPLGMGGNIVINLDSVELSTGSYVGLDAHRQFKGRSHTIRMAVGMAIAAAIYLPVAPALLLTRGRDSVILKGTEITAYTNADAFVETEDLPVARQSGSELSDMITSLPSRALNADGREGDMLNLIFMATEDELQRAFARSGWLIVEKSTPQIIWHLLRQRMHYTKLPMDRLFVFGRVQDYSYSLPDPAAIVAHRHHLRIWKTDRELNGIPLWVGAATHDVAIEYIKRQFRLRHKIDPNVDEEREFIAANLAETKQLTYEQYMRCPAPIINAQTATGQEYYSDSRMLFLELNQGADQRPGATEVAAKLQ